MQTQRHVWLDALCLCRDPAHSKELGRDESVPAVHTIACVREQKSVRDSVTCASQVATPVSAAAIQSFCPSMTKLGGKPPILLERVNQIASPLTNIIVVSVAMNAGIRQVVTANPLTMPIPTPTSNIAINPKGTASA